MEFISLRAAARILGTHRERILGLIEDGTLTVRQVSGGFRQVVRGEIERLARESLKVGRMAGSDSTESE